MSVVSFEISICEKVGNHPFLAFLFLFLTIYRGVGAGCAALSAFTAASAQVAPLSRHLPWHRRRLRRSLGIYRGIGAGCAALSAFTAASAGVPASLSAFAAASAGVPASLSAFTVASAQVAPLSRHLPRRRREFPPLSRHLPRRRRRLRRSLGICRGLGAGCAALSAFAAASAGVPTSLSAFTAASAGVPASLSAFTGAAGEKCADRLLAEKDCLRRTHVNYRRVLLHAACTAPITGVFGLKSRVNLLS